MADLANRIKELRKSKNLTQTEFGQIFGIVKSTVSLYESGKSTPNDEIKKKICEYFNVSFDYLLGRTDKKDIEKETYNNLDPLDALILKRYHKADTFDQIAVLRILDIKEKVGTEKLKEAK